MNPARIEARAAKDIDIRVARLLCDLGNPSPPLQLADVRALLALDRHYYSSSDDGILRETIHRLMLAGKQVIRQPRRLLDVVRRMDLKALWVPERQQILLDTEMPTAKQRWAEGHEIGHGIIPWHKAVLHGDKLRTLSPGSAYVVEEEANYAAGQMLFLRETFRDMLESAEKDMTHIRELARIFGNSITSTLWRVVEDSDGPAFALVSQHPREDLTDKPLHHFVRSGPFAERFGHVSPMKVFETAATYCRPGGGPLGHGELVLLDADTTSHLFSLSKRFTTAMNR